MANLNFNATDIDPSDNFEPIPPGQYPVQIVHSEMRPTKRGDGQYLFVELEVLDGEHQGRRVFDRLNLQNPNQDTVAIAQRALSQIAHAVGVLDISDSEQLHFKPLLANVTVQPPKGDYSASNQVRGYRPLPVQVQAPPPAAAPKPVVPISSSTSGKARAWKTHIA
jgi:hypothetical protein